MMKKMISLITCILFLFSTVSAESSDTCLDANTLQITKDLNLTVDGSVDTIEVLEQKNCPGGCYNGECKPIQSNMPMELYILFSVAGMTLMIIGFFRESDMVIKFVAMGIFFMLGVTSFNLNRIYCEYTSSGWECFVHQYTATNLAYLWFGLGGVMFIYAFIGAVWGTGKKVGEALEGR